MKIEKTNLKSGTSDVPQECQSLIERLKSCSRKELLQELMEIDTWVFGKCELYHWIDVLNIYDEILEEAASVASGKFWELCCDVNADTEEKELLLWVLHFTALLIEHSFSRHLYNSMEHLITLLSSCDMNVVLGVLNLLYMFSKRSNFISRLNLVKRSTLVCRLTCLAESWGGKENGFGLAECCQDLPMQSFPPGATTLHFEYSYNDPSGQSPGSRNKKSLSQNTCIRLERVDLIKASPAEIVKDLITVHNIPVAIQISLFTKIRLAHYFSDYKKRLMCVRARLQALSILESHSHQLLFTSLLKELVEVLELPYPDLVEIHAAALRTLTSVIHFHRNLQYPRLKTIIDMTGASSYYGFLPVLVRRSIKMLNSNETCHSESSFHLAMTHALFDFLYSLASYGEGVEALLNSGMLECLLRVIDCPGKDVEHVMLLTRAMHMIDLMTNINMQAFQTHGDLTSFINRLEMEVEFCHKEQPFELKLSNSGNGDDYEYRIPPESDSMGAVEVQQQEASNSTSIVSRNTLPDYCTSKTGKTCLPQRAALIKSILQHVIKATKHSLFTDSIRHIMGESLPASLKHIISNVEYYGPSLFLLATDVVTVFLLQQHALLSSLQDNGLTDVVLQFIFLENVPVTRGFLGSLPNIFKCLTLNAQGLDSFIQCQPFERLFKVLLSPVYLSSMKRRRNSDPNGDTASNLGNAMDELMRHQPSLKVHVIAAVIKLLEELCSLGRDQKYMCRHLQNKEGFSPTVVHDGNGRNYSRENYGDGGSSDEEDEEEASLFVTPSTTQPSREENIEHHPNKKIPIPLIDYILNAMKFLGSIWRNNSTHEYCQEFVMQKGLTPLISIVGLPNLPVENINTTLAMTVSAPIKAVMEIVDEPEVLCEGMRQLNDVLNILKPLHHKSDPTCSVLLHELTRAPDLEIAFITPSATPVLHAIAAAHGYIVMLMLLCQSEKKELRSLTVSCWGSELGVTTLKGLSELYTSLLWENTLLYSLINIDEFYKEDLDKMKPKEHRSLADNNTWGCGTSAEETESNVCLPLDSEAGMIMDFEAESKASGKSKTGKSYALPQQMKYIKPLLSASSQLSQVLAELWGLLINLCYGQFSERSLMQSHEQQQPSPQDKIVADTLADLLRRSVTWTELPSSLVSKYRFTYLLNAVRLISLWFDEKRYPCHAKLQCFVECGGMSACFDIYRRVLSANKIHFSGEVQSSLPDGTGEFIVSWLILIEKLVNARIIFEKPNYLADSEVSSNQLSSLQYLIHIHQKSFIELLALWGKKPLPKYGAQITESVLSIYRHIIEGENLIQDERPPKKEDLDWFTSEALDICLKYGDQFPNHLYRINELLGTIIKRNGTDYLNNILDYLKDQLVYNLNIIMRTAVEGSRINAACAVQSSLAAIKVGTRADLLMLLMEEMQLPCLSVAENGSLLSRLVQFLVISHNYTGPTPPRWMYPVLTFIDLLIRISDFSNRKIMMHKLTTRTWKRYFLKYGKWIRYPPSVDSIISKSYLNGESSVHVIIHSVKYCIQFGSMTEVNDVTGSKRLVMMSLKQDRTLFSKYEKLMNNGKEGKESESMYDINNRDQVSKRNIVLTVMSQAESEQLIRVCVNLLKSVVDANNVNALLRICLRLTRDYKIASIFAEIGGVRLILSLTMESTFAGCENILTLLIRHVIEEPRFLRIFFEEVLRLHTLSNISPSRKEIIYMMRMCSSSVCRDPDIFTIVAKAILRVDTSILSRENFSRNDERLLVKSLPPKTCQLDTYMEEISKKAISDLLDALIVNVQDDKPIAVNAKPSQQSLISACGNQSGRCGGFGRNTAYSNALPQDANVEVPPAKHKVQLNISDDRSEMIEEEKKKPLLLKSTILKLLSDILSFNPIFFKRITRYRYQKVKRNLTTEAYTALGFIFDMLYVPNDTDSEDKKCSEMAEMLLSSIVLCNHCIEDQITILQEMKHALQRALSLPESTEKLDRIKLLCGLISIFIESCPPAPLPYRSNMNHMVGIMEWKSLVADLAKIPSNLDLSSQYMAPTMNAVLKPLEKLTFLLSQPPNVKKISKPAPFQSTTEYSLGQQTGNNMNNNMNENVLAARGQQLQYQYSTENPNLTPALPQCLQPDHGLSLSMGETLQQGIRDIRDQEGYLFEPSPAALLSIISTMYWWDLESKLLDGESAADCVTIVYSALEGFLDMERNVELMEHKMMIDRKEKYPHKSMDKESLIKMKNYSETENSEHLVVENNELQTLEANVTVSNVYNEPVHLPQCQQVARRARNFNQFESRPHSVSPELAFNIVMQSISNSNEPENMSSIPTLTENVTDQNLGIPNMSVTESNQLGVADVVNNRPRLQLQGENSVMVLTDNAHQNSNSRDGDGHPMENSVQDVVTYEDNGQGSLMRRNWQVDTEYDVNAMPFERVSEDVGGVADNSINLPIVRAGQIEVDAGNEISPEGVEPSFLAALPEEMREEIVSEQLRLQKIRQIAQTPAAADKSVAEVPIAEVNPNFLAALPPLIQEEVLARQQFDAAAAAKTDDHVDAVAFLHNPPPNLHTQNIREMEESQTSALSSTEAANMHREGETRNSGHMETRETILAVPQQQCRSWASHDDPATAPLASSSITSSGAMVGPHYQSSMRDHFLLDEEAMTCLLVLALVDEPRLIAGHLHRVVRNLCFNPTTREWLLKTLLSIFEKCENGQQLNVEAANVEYRSKNKRSSQLLQQAKDSKSLLNASPSLANVCTRVTTWLNISVDAPLGCGANIFNIQRPSGKRGIYKLDAASVAAAKLTIQLHAAPTVCRGTLELMITLAELFPSCYLPMKTHEIESLRMKLSSQDNECLKQKLRAIYAGNGGGLKTKVGPTNFWELLVKLDMMSASKKGKNDCRSDCTLTPPMEFDFFNVTFDTSAFGHLVAMLSYPVIRSSTVLIDKLLKLLSLISLGLPDSSPHDRKIDRDALEITEESEEKREYYQRVRVPEEYIKLAIEVITSKSCSEEGLEDAMSLLLNWSYGPASTQDMILKVLLSAAQELGNVVYGQISTLLKNLKILKIQSHCRENCPTNIEEKIHDRQPAKGVLGDRFTKSIRLVTAPTKVKHNSDLHIPAMIPMTSKTSSQVFFLRIVRVIIQIRDTVQLKIRKSKRKGIQKAAESDTSTAVITETINIGTGISGAKVVVSSEQPRPMHVDSQERILSSHSNLPVQASRQRETVALRLFRAQRSVEEGYVGGLEERGHQHRSKINYSGQISQTEGSSSNQYSPQSICEPSSSSYHAVPGNGGYHDEEVVLPNLSEELYLDKLWRVLTDCLLELQDTLGHHAVLVLQPAVEAFFLIHASSGDEDVKDRKAEECLDTAEFHEVLTIQEQHELASVSLLPSEGEAPPVATTALSSDAIKYIKFAETHRLVLNQLLRQSTSPILEGPYAVLVDHTRLLDFDIKIMYFRDELQRLNNEIQRGKISMCLRRSNILEDSFHVLNLRHADDWKNQFQIIFQGEEGQDCGGLLREWYVILLREVLNPNYNLFMKSPGDRVTYTVKPSSNINPMHLHYFKFAGRVIAKAVWEGQTLECHFVNSFLKHILGIPVKYTDMESEDISFFNGMRYLMKNHVSDLGDLTFSTEVQEFGETEIRDLIPNGRNIYVSEDNKMDYVNLVCQMKMTGSIKKQLEAFNHGFYDIIPKKLISIFNEQELGLLISGLPYIDIDELQENTEYYEYQASSPQINWFWWALRSFEQADQAKFLQFVTGTPKVPLQGFAALEGMNGIQKFQIHRDGSSTDRLPSASTCINQLNLPVYETYEKLRRYLLKAIQECSEGFGFA